MKLKLLFLPLSLAVALFMFIYFTKPTWDSYSQSKSDLAKNEQDLKTIKDSKKTLDNSLDTFNSVSAEKKFLLQNSIPTSLQEENLLRELNSISSDSGAKISSISLKKVDDFEKIKELQEKNGIEITKAEVSLNGNYFGLRRALFSIESTNRFIKVNSFAIKENTQLGNLDLALDLSFFHKEQADVKFSSSSSYSKSLLKDGLDIATIDQYMESRQRVINFSSLDVGEKGKDDVFSSGGGAVEDEEPVVEAAVTETSAN